MSASCTVTQTTKQKTKKIRLKVVSSKVSKRVQLHVWHKNDRSQTTGEVALTKEERTRQVQDKSTMVKNNHIPTVCPRSQGTDTDKCPRKPRITGTRTNLVRRSPCLPVYDFPKRLSSDQRERCPPTPRISGTHKHLARRSPSVPVYSVPRRRLSGQRFKWSTPHTNLARRSCLPVYNVPRRRSSGQREKPTQRHGCPTKTEQVSSPRRSRSVPNVQANAQYGNRRVRKTNSVPEALPERPIRERHVTSPAKRSLDKTKLPDRNVPNGPFERFFKEKVSLSMKDISQNSESVNDIILHILKEVHRKDKRFVMRRLNSGSYYEHLKVSRPCEFDVMLVLDAHCIEQFFFISCPIRLTDPCVGYAKLDFKDHVSGGRNVWGEFLTRDGKCLSPRKTVKRFYDLVREALQAMQTAQGKRVSNIRLNGPAVTLTLDGKIDLDLVLSVEIRGWPQCSSAWGNLASSKTWPTQSTVEQIKLKSPKFHLVAKICSAEEGIQSDSQRYWRISFSEAEKALLSPAAPGNEKKFYKIAKAIFEAKKKRFTPLTSYHLKTLFLHLRRERPRARRDDSNLGESVVNFFKSLINQLEEGRLQHFFVSNKNLFKEIVEETRASLVREVVRLLSELLQDPEKVLRTLTL